MPAATRARTWSRAGQEGGLCARHVGGELVGHDEQVTGVPRGQRRDVLRAVAASADQGDGVHDRRYDGHARAVDDDGVVVLCRRDDARADAHEQGAHEQDVGAGHGPDQRVHRQDPGVGEQDGTSRVVRDDLVEGLAVPAHGARARFRVRCGVAHRRLLR
ncbi:hypothetical protein ACRJ4W_26655 [Streptomyces sp. GLT-R25]